MPAKNTPTASKADDIQAEKEAKLRAVLARVKTIRAKNTAEENLKVWGKDSTGKLEDNKSPGRVYQWINIDPRRIGFFESREYVVCNATNSPDVITRWKKDDGTHVNGDAILMMVDRELKEALEQDDALRSMERDRLSPGGMDPETAAWARANKVAMVPLSGE